MLVAPFVGEELAQELIWGLGGGYIVDYGRGMRMGRKVVAMDHRRAMESEG